MNNIFVVSAVISVIFLIAQFIEMRFIEKDNKPLKILIRDALLVYFSVISGYFILNQIEPTLNDSSKITPIFTDNPGF